MNVLLDQTFVKEQYYISGNIIKGYGVLMLTRYPCYFFEMLFPTVMGRSLLVAEPVGGVSGHHMLVGTVHLESGNSAEVRKKQLQMAINVLKTCHSNVLLGDFNFHSTWSD